MLVDTPRAGNLRDIFAQVLVSSHNPLEIPPAVTCGEEVICSQGILSGHGIVSEEKVSESPNDSQQSIAHYATINGRLVSVNSLVYVEPLHSKYIPEAGDLVVGRIVEVGQGRWLMDIGSANRGILQLAAIVLPSGEQRRKTEAEVIDMRRFFQEDDILCTEVQKVSADGTCLLHTRNTRYGKLKSGCYVGVPSTLVQRLAQHSQLLANGVHIIVGNNGYIWIGSPPYSQWKDTLNFSPDLATADYGGKYHPVTPTLRAEIVKVKNCVLFLAQNFIKISPATIISVLGAVKALGIPTWKICKDNKLIQILAHLCADSSTDA